MTKLELDLYYVKTIHILNFKSISQRTTEKSQENRVDRQTDGEETYSPPGFTDRGLI